MSDDHQEFGRRLQRLNRRHRAMARGYTAHMGDDGLVEVRPRRLQFKLPVRGCLLVVACFMFFKGFMLASLGSDVYSARLNALRTGGIHEQAGAYVMGIDPVSGLISQLLSPYIR